MKIDNHYLVESISEVMLKKISSITNSLKPDFVTYNQKENLCYEIYSHINKFHLIVKKMAWRKKYKDFYTDNEYFGILTFCFKKDALVVESGNIIKNTIPNQVYFAITSLALLEELKN